VVEEHPPLNAVSERFGSPGASVPQVHMKMLESIPLPRLWFLNQPGTELIQIQQDRFVHNWRKVGEGDAYPRYERLRGTFRTELESFQSLVMRERLGSILPNQCEVTYVNHIIADNGWTTHAQLGDILTVFQSKYSDTRLGDPEDARLTIRYILFDESRKPSGRLHVEAQPAFRRSDNKAMYIVSLTARLRPQGQCVEDVVCCIDLGRDAIVGAFASITTPIMHKIWGRRDA
jgi:uncharacterized protein (TIGR04255 family)